MRDSSLLNHDRGRVEPNGGLAGAGTETEWSVRTRILVCVFMGAAQRLAQTVESLRCAASPEVVR